MLLHSEHRSGRRSEGTQQLLDRINALNKEQFDTEIAQLKLIVNIPNDENGDGAKKRSHDDIDWEEIPEDEIKEAIGFFVNGPTR